MDTLVKLIKVLFIVDMIGTGIIAWFLFVFFGKLGLIIDLGLLFKLGLELLIYCYVFKKGKGD